MPWMEKDDCDIPFPLLFTCQTRRPQIVLACLSGVASYLITRARFSQILLSIVLTGNWVVGHERLM